MTEREPRTVTLRRESWTKDELVTVGLVPRRCSESEHEAYLDGTFIGIVGRYTGSLDRRIPIGGRFLRQPGKPRTLWSARLDDRDRPMYGRVSRAEAIRYLLGHHERRR